MKTVKDFANAGLLFTKGDKCTDGVVMYSDDWFTSIDFRKWGDYEMVSFVWRDNDCVRPFINDDAMVDVKYTTGEISTDVVKNINWSEQITEWRPHIGKLTIDVKLCGQSFKSENGFIKTSDLVEKLTHKPTPNPPISVNGKLVPVYYGGGTGTGSLVVLVDDIPAPVSPVANKTALDLLADCTSVQKERADEYKDGGERSFNSVSTAFNAITGKDVTPAEVALLLQVLKDVRQWSKDRLHPDSVLDSVSYASLKGEELYKQYRED